MCDLTCNDSEILANMTRLKPTQNVMAHLNTQLLTAHKTAHVSKHVSSVSKQVRTKHHDGSPAERQNMWQQEWVLQQVQLPRRCFWTCYLGGNMQAIQHITYTWWLNRWQPNRRCFSSTSGGNFQQITHSGFKEIQNFPTEKPTFPTLDTRLKDEKMTHFSGSKFISSGMGLFIVRGLLCMGKVHARNLQLT